MSLLHNARRRVIRANPNPLDKCTVVSIFPKPIKEIKHTIQPGLFEIAPGSYEKPSLLVVGASSWWRDVSDNEPLLEIPVHSIQVADALINDYLSGLHAASRGVAGPGLFFVTGDVKEKELRDKYQEKLDDAQLQQKVWFKRLVDIADVLWSRSNGNPLSISQDMRLAAKELQMNDKPWMANSKNLTLVPCPACGTLRDDRYPVCMNCKTVVDPATFKAKGLQLAV